MKQSCVVKDRFYTFQTFPLGQGHALNISCYHSLKPSTLLEMGVEIVIVFTAEAPCQDSDKTEMGISLCKQHPTCSNCQRLHEELDNQSVASAKGQTRLGIDSQLTKQSKSSGLALKQARFRSRSSQDHTEKRSYRLDTPQQVYSYVFL